MTQSSIDIICNCLIIVVATLQYVAICKIHQNHSILDSNYQAILYIFVVYGLYVYKYGVYLTNKMSPEARIQGIIDLTQLYQLQP